eukprot:Hpha_TRINITY_DN15902_c0_g8::TRINITY_DN15902_c0_g8_i1::g.71161::m.71161
MILDLTRVLVLPPEEGPPADPSGVAAALVAQGEATVGSSFAVDGRRFRVFECAPATRGAVTPDTVVVLLRPAPPSKESAAPVKAAEPLPRSVADPLLRLSPIFAGSTQSTVCVRTRFSSFDSRFDESPDDFSEDVWIARASSRAAGQLRLAGPEARLELAPEEVGGGSYVVTVEVDSALEGDDLLLTPAAFANVFKHRPGLRGLRDQDDKGASAQVEIVRGSVSAPPDAEFVEIRPVKMPALSDPPSDLIDESLRRYFGHPRVLHVGDVFSVPFEYTPVLAESAVAVLMEAADDPVAEVPTVAHFVVAAAKVGGAEVNRPEDARYLGGGHSFTVLQGHTALSYQTGSVQAGLPCKAPVCEAGLEGSKPLRELIEFVTSVVSVADYSASCLLIGTEENAVSSLVPLAAAAAGCHLLRVSCHTAAKGLNEVKSLVKIAADSAPCVIEFVHAEAHFAKKRGGEEGPGDDQLTPAIEEALQGRGGVVVVCSTPTEEGLPASFIGGFVGVVRAENPSQEDRQRVAANLQGRVRTSCAVGAEKLARQTAGLPYSAMCQIFTGAAKACVRRVLEGEGKG